MVKRAVVDLGTHTFLLLIAEKSPDGKIRVLREEERFVSLGKGATQSNVITEAAFRRARAALLEYSRLLKKEGVRNVRCVATAVFRSAKNAPDIKARLEKASGLTIEVLSGTEEARLIHLAAERTFPRLRDMTVVDIGGGSVEITESHDQKISLPLGAIRLTERFLRAFPVPEGDLKALRGHLRAEFRGKLEGYFRSEKRPLVGVSGTFTTAASMEQKLRTYCPEKITGFRLKRKSVEKWLKKLSGMTLEDQKKIPGLQPQRAGLVVAGMALILELCDYFNADEITVCNEGLRFGVLYDSI